MAKAFLEMKAVLEMLRSPTTTVPLAGAAFGLSRNGSYEAAARGEIPTVRFNKILRVPTVPLCRMLGLEPVLPLQSPKRLSEMDTRDRNSLLEISGGKADGEAV